MSNPSLLTLDVYHMTVLNHLLAECSVTRVAEILDQPQPNISRILRRLRTVFDDPLLVRSGARLVATERAQEIRESLQEVLSRIEFMTAREAVFDPGRSEREFRIASADCVETGLSSRVISLISSAGSRLQVTMRGIDPAFEIERALEEGDIDLVIDNDPTPPENLMCSTLYTDEVVCMMRADHPLAGLSGLTMNEYLRANHLAPQLSSRTKLGPVDGELHKRGIERSIGARVPEYNMVPYVLACTDFIFTTSRRFAEHYGRLLPLRVMGAPEELPPMRFYQLWHERSHNSPAGRWLRRQVLAAARRI